LKNLLAAAVLVLSGPAFFLAVQANPSQHFGIGRWDRAWLCDEEDFPPSRMEGPFRHPDGTVEVKDFVAGLTKKRASLTLPYHALRSPVEIRVRIFPREWLSYVAEAVEEAMSVPGPNAEEYTRAVRRGSILRRSGARGAPSEVPPLLPRVTRRRDRRTDHGRCTREFLLRQYYLLTATGASFRKSTAMTALRP
jgi:hypothetical protein